MSFTKSIKLFAAAIIIAAAIISIFFSRVETAHSEPAVAESAITPEEYKNICGLADVECPHEKQATVTGYTSRVEETDDTPCLAAFGHDICKLRAAGRNVCASNDYAKGTILAIEGLGTCEVLDRMNARYTGTGRVDWYFGHDLAAARKWGIKKVSIIIE